MFGRTDQAHGNERRQTLRDLCTSAASSKQWPVLANKNGGLSDTEWFYVISSTCTFAPGDYGYQSFSISSHCVYLRFERANNFVIKLAEKWSARQRLQTVMWSSICMTSLDIYTVFWRSCREKSRNFWRIKAELTKHREGKIVGPIFQCFILVLALSNRGTVVFSHCRTNHFMFAWGNSSSSRCSLHGILKTFLWYALSSVDQDWYLYWARCR